MGFCEILMIVFIVLKLLEVISWSWWLVLLPEIIVVAFYIIIFVLASFGVGSTSYRVSRRKRRF